MSSRLQKISIEILIYERFMRLLAQSSPQKGKPKLSSGSRVTNPISSSTLSAEDAAMHSQPSVITLAEFAKLVPGTRCNMTVLCSSAYPLKEVVSPSFSGAILNIGLSDSTLGKE